MNDTTAAAESIDAFLRDHERKELLRFITCGSVDDGKSTLIGRLLYDSHKILEDQLAAVRNDSTRWGTTGEDTDLALLVDGLQAEREQGITIDVAYRYFDTQRRKYIIADTPGHEQYTRNMATGASTAQLAVILVDAARGVKVQTRRHSFIVSLMGIRHVIVAVNKMDAVDFSREVFESIRLECEEFIGRLGVREIHCVPVSALRGDNVVHGSSAMPWYTGKPLQELLDTIELAAPADLPDLRFPVQYVNRPDASFRGYAGTLAAGFVRQGDAVMALPSRRMSRVRSIVTHGGELAQAGVGHAVTLTLEDELDISRGDVLVHSDRAPSVGDRFDAHVIWMADAPLLPGKQYEFKIGTRHVFGTIEELHHRIDVNDLSEHAAAELKLNEIALCRIALAEQVAFDAYGSCRETGGFIVIDRLQHGTVGAGMIRRAAGHVMAERAGNLFWAPTRVTRQQRANQKGQAPCILWFTGLSGSGKSTVANAVEQMLFLRGHHSYLLDGDNVRHGLNKDLDFSDAGRVENIRRIGEVAKLFVDAGLIVLTAFISPFRSDRQLVRELVQPGEFVEIYLSTALEVCESRDPKGLYAKARSGGVKDFTGVSSPYEAPESAEIVLDTEKVSVGESVERIVRFLEGAGRLRN
jgi:bifunctional enzyme CysN/CysC